MFRWSIMEISCNIWFNLCSLACLIFKVWNCFYFSSYDCDSISNKKIGNTKIRIINTQICSVTLIPIPKAMLSTNWIPRGKCDYWFTPHHTTPHFQRELAPCTGSHTFFPLYSLSRFFYLYFLPSTSMLTVFFMPLNIN